MTALLVIQNEMKDLQMVALQGDLSQARDAALLVIPNEVKDLQMVALQGDPSQTWDDSTTCHPERSEGSPK
jgi:hypothetical protein